MKLLRNRGNDRVVDHLRGHGGVAAIRAATSSVSAFGITALLDSGRRIPTGKLLLPPAVGITDSVAGDEADRAERNRLILRGAARRSLDWFNRVETRVAPGRLPQSTLIVETVDGQRTAMVGSCALTTAGLGLTPAERLGMVQLAEGADESAMLGDWFEEQWQALDAGSGAQAEIAALFAQAADRRSAGDVYLRVLDSVFADMGEGTDEDSIVKSATGIRNTVIWSKLYRFQRDGAIGAIDKLQRFGGCIIADSVGLGKTFEALAVIKYHELRNDRVLVLCPKRLRENWTIWKQNDRRNMLSADRFNYDVLNHTDLSRDGGQSGDIDLAHINWGNYDLIVIDESHNFRNKSTHRDRETRYDKLMRQVIQAGVRTKVLMLSATPVNNRLADLKNQIAFATEGNDAALADQNIPSIEGTIRFAQAAFNRWLAMSEEKRTSERLLDMLGFDYFRLLDLLTIARSRKHIERYYGTAETGRFPERRPPLNIKANVDTNDAFPPIGDINADIRRLTLAAYAPLRYVLASKREAYDRAYNQQVRGGKSVFRQLDREESLVHLLRINLLKRMESSVHSFALTLERQLETVNALIARIDAHEDAIEEVSIDDIEVDDPLFETLGVGRSVRVLLADADRVRWRQDLTEDRILLEALLAAARTITPERDAKLTALHDFIASKQANPFNAGNRKVIVFTAFADTAAYLYGELATAFSGAAALVTGAGTNKTTAQGVRSDLGSILSAFSPRSKGRPEDIDEPEIDLLIATDVISEGQNLQDCDCLINYDIHWNPVRIVQRFGRIDRLGSRNAVIQLVNFWPNIDLDAYIGLERRVSGRMVLLDVSATGEENIIEAQAGDTMNDLDYRRRQLETLQTTVIDLEDLSSGVSIADLTLNDLRIDLVGLSGDERAALARMPLTAHAVVAATDEIPSGAIFCLRAETPAALAAIAIGDPLRPHVLVHVGEDGGTLLPSGQAKRVLDRLKWLGDRGRAVDVAVWDRFDKETRSGMAMEQWRDLLATAIGTITGKAEERAVASLFSPGGTVGGADFAGIDDWEVVAWIAVMLPE